MRVHPPPACVAEMKRFWNEEVWDKPFSHRVPVKGFSRLDVQAMEHLGMADTPPVESSVANHLNLSRRAALSSIAACNGRTCFERDVPPYSLSSGVIRGDGASAGLQLDSGRRYASLQI